VLDHFVLPPQLVQLVGPNQGPEAPVQRGNRTVIGPGVAKEAADGVVSADRIDKGIRIRIGLRIRIRRIRMILQRLRQLPLSTFAFVLTIDFQRALPVGDSEPVRHVRPPGSCAGKRPGVQAPSLQHVSSDFNQSWQIHKIPNSIPRLVVPSSWVMFIKWFEKYFSYFDLRRSFNLI
jgi:hypothetical protein